ncbi:MAG: hypothetical protein A4E70_02140 [Syntrophus sp. PtaU1.Bin005]|jgi:hypothetical protein|uniref:hypothetical protein n=1 Tax=Syntrophus buswellii TaxID=43774 RepID=UPI0009CECDDE|nr:MAG: hypothetical protein A4E70_02140 [Syntrophus sp. PtaU1.Bin005]
MKKYLCGARSLAAALLVLSVLILGVQSPAQAGLTLTLDDGTNPVITVADTDNDGYVYYSGAIGNWIMNLSGGFSVGNLMDLVSGNVSSSAGGTMTVTLTDTDFSDLSSFHVGGTTGGSVTFNLYNDSNLVASYTGDTPSFSTDIASLTSTGSITEIEAVIIHEGSAMSSFDANVVQNPVPVPAAFWLLGSGLMGLIGIRRRGARG